MSLKMKSGRQETIAAEIDVSHEDVNRGVSEIAVDLPSGAIITGGMIAVLEGFDSGTSDSIDLGSSSEGADYADGVSLREDGVTPLTLTGRECGPDGAVYATFGGEGTAPTKGKMRIVVQYIVKGRAAFAHGKDARATRS